MKNPLESLKGFLQRDFPKMIDPATGQERDMTRGEKAFEIISSAPVIGTALGIIALAKTHADGTTFNYE